MADASAVRLVLFDIDGTLIRTGGAGGRALNEAWRELFGESNAFADVSFVGSTDELILDQVFQTHRGHAGAPEDRAALIDRYIDLLPDFLALCDYQVNPGVRETLARMEAMDAILLGLATGNVERAARLKLHPASLNGHFPFGGFGCDAASREEMTAHAVAEGARQLGLSPEALDVIVVGDSVYDIRCAHAVGGRAVAVCTGWTAEPVLAAEAPALLLTDLSQPEIWMRRIGLA